MAERARENNMPDVPQLQSLNSFADEFDDPEWEDAEGVQAIPETEPAPEPERRAEPEPEPVVAESSTEPEETPEAAEPEKAHWSVKEVTKLRGQRREAQDKYDSQAEELKTLRAQMTAFMGGQQQAQQPVAKPADDFDSFLKEIGLDEGSDDGYTEQPRASSEMAQMLYAQKQQLSQQRQWMEQQASSQMQTQIRSQVSSIREDHPMVPERVLLNAIANGLDPVDTALQVRSAFESYSGTQSSASSVPAPLTTPPTGSGAKKEPAQPKKPESAVPSWAAGRGKIPNLIDSMMAEFEENPL